ncbi:MAG: hypothetical protein EU540_02150 [Promethearchaeota archaeon]|nr:MAG: hypothetical protein EU540_02150 [Candidatus Lokiarchaeota archaeon]
MSKINKINLNLSKRFFLVIVLFLNLLILNLYFENTTNFNVISIEEDISSLDVISEIDDLPKTSALWAWINLTNDYEVDNQRFYHNTTITIEGILYNYTVGPSPTTQGIQGYKIALEIDGIINSSYNNITDSKGNFRIQNYTVPFSMNIYTSHRIKAQVIGSKPGDVTRNNDFTIFANATSYFDIDNYNLNNPQLAGGFYKIPGFLRYDNSSGIPNQIINSTWKSETNDYLDNISFNTNSYGSFKYIQIPDNNDDNVSKIFYLNLTYNGNSTYINRSQELISVRIYRNITCVWNTVGSADMGDTITIRGQLFARNNSNLVINFTDVRITRNYATIANLTTDSNGNFNCSFTFPTGSAGNNIFRVEIANFSNIFSNTAHIIRVTSAPIIPAEDIGDDDEDTPPPFQNFFIVFIPIIIGIVAVLLVFIYIHLRKQKAESLVVKLPLEDRIRNLKILKDTERLEEALSYLFKSIYLELINAKYGRRMKESETIRDIAIISVREFKLKPAHVYPFIQNIEKIIYDKPFLIEEKDFYALVELFSPLYYEFTGYHFILNF